MSTATNLSSLGLTNSDSISVVHEGQAYTVNLNADMTVDDMFTALAAYGINGSITADNKIKFTGTPDGFITAFSSNLATKLGVTAGSGNTWSSSTQTIFTNTTSSNQEHDEVTTLNTSSTLGRLGMNAEGTVDVNYEGRNYTVTFTSDATVNDVISTLAGYGIAGQVIGGKLSLTGTNNGYITAMSENMRTALKLSAGEGNTYSTSSKTVYTNTRSDLQDREVTTTMSTSNTLADLGLNANAVITVMQQGTEFTITVNPNQTVNDVLSTLSGYGISGFVADGRITFAGGTRAYIKDMEQALKDALKLKTGENYSWESGTSATWVNSDSRDLSVTDNTLLIDNTTVLNTINGWNNGNGSLVVHKTDGTYTTISIDATKTVDDFFHQISEYGLVGTLGDDGKITITGIGDVYLQSTAGGSNILSAIKIGSATNVNTQITTATSNKTSDILDHTVTIAANGTTTLGDAESSTGSKITFDGSNHVSLVLTTTSDAGNQNVTLTFNKTDTIYDVIDELANYGIQASIDAIGRFSMTSSTLNDFDISGTLGSFLMGAYSKDYGVDTTYNITQILSKKEVVEMDDSTVLSDLNVTSGNFEITQEGVAYTVNIANTATVGDFRNLLAQYGLTSYIDDEGHLTVIGVGESWLDSVGGGSNIVSQFGLDKNNWTLGEITQTSTSLNDKETVRGAATWANTLAQLTDSEGNNLGIDSGNIYVYQDGTRNTVNISKNDSLQTIASKLSQYGISMGLASDGQIYFDGDNNTYMEDAAGSSILYKIGANSTWSQRLNSTSDNLKYTETHDTVVKGSTKLKNLKSGGENLGITDGSYYIYENGVQNTLEIDDDTTVNDLMADMALYGLIADIDEDGSISISGHNNSYMATSSLMGANSNLMRNMFDTTWDFTNIYTTNNLDMPVPELHSINRDTKLADIVTVTGEGTTVSAGYTEGVVTVTKDGIQTNISLTSDDTLGTLMDELSLFGFDTVINDSGQLIVRATGDSRLSAGSTSSGYSNILDIMGINDGDPNDTNWIKTNNYDGSELSVIEHSIDTVAAARDTALSELGVTTGEYYIYSNGVKYTAMISSDETVGSLMDTLNSFGVQTSIVEDGGAATLKILGSGNTYVTHTASTTTASNVDSLFSYTEETKLYTSSYEDTKQGSIRLSNATEDTLVSTLNAEYGKQLQGKIAVSVDGVESTLNIEEGETLGSVLNKFRALGVEANIYNGRIVLQSGYKTLSISDGGLAPSSVSDLIKGINVEHPELSTSILQFDNDINNDDGVGVTGYAASSVVVKATKDIEANASVSKFANGETNLSLLGITNGTLTVYRNGQKHQVTIEDSETFASLEGKVQGGGYSDIRFNYDNGYLTVYSTEGNAIMVGATTDTSNFASITGIASYDRLLIGTDADDDNNTVVTNAARSARELYCVNGESKITTSGLFQRGNVTEGTFTVGDAVITIDSNTTLSDIVNQINSNKEASQAYAYWDNVSGQFLIQSNKTGSSFINIEAGTSNFTDIMGYTQDGAINTATQKVGENAKFSINGTTYTSTENIIKSDISRIQGVTINLKNASEGEKIELKIERDTETLANAVADVVDSYNDLMKNLDEQIAIGGTLHKETTLSLIRDQLKRVMSSGKLKDFGITIPSFSAGNIGTSNADIVSLSFDKETFMSSFLKDQAGLKDLLCGDNSTTGIFTQLENTVVGAVSQGGYFDTTERSYKNQISNLNDKIKRANEQVTRYKEMLEKKFSAMDMLIAKMNQQYSSFLQS